MIHDDAHYTCGACAIPMTDDECVDAINLETHECDVICNECAEFEYISDDFHVIPEHAFTDIPTPVETQDHVGVLEIRSEWDSVTDVIHSAEVGEYEDAEDAMEQELIE